ncbi:type II toxin-antitoxin system ParD family antitoxin [Salinarimonas sp. NSM]|uniref:type II toxin-antitoxin system ParD family antitoxin n=1 Tax=Salinarimonas sp. NSM TaxID=3458003 RepID=UPI004035E3F3
MTDASPILVSRDHKAFVERLVETGRFGSAQDVLESALDLLREQVEETSSSRADLRRLLLERLEGPFVSSEEMEALITEMIEREHGENEP